MTVNLQSTLISNNSVGSDPDDMTIYEKVTPPAHTMTFNAGPANNLVYATVVTKLPADTKKNNVIYCPFLGPLRNNGGLTETHALMSGSQAINAGNDSVLTALYDQRGSAATNGALDYSRYSGSGAIADIGAYEVQYPDTLFNSSFDGCLTII